LKFTKYDKVWHCSYIWPWWGPEKVFSNRILVLVGTLNRSSCLCMMGW